ncbi:MAG: hypothetical protein KAS07_03175 [Candidatus Pacebacteria bacterium]|nr:hypothetical protein [Candidatus Paceibacterota bacterium]
MEFKQTFGDIVDSEKEMFLTALERYEDFFVNASEFNSFLNEFLKSVDADRFIFAMFLSQVRKHSTLALLSVVRLHHVQATMNLRQVLEAGSCAAYAIANTDRSGFADIDKDGFLNPSQKLTVKRYKWLDDNYPAGAVSIQNMKNVINKSSAHANIVTAHNNFTFDRKTGKFSTPFFDIEDDYWVKTDLWSIANILMGLMDLFYGVNKKYDAIKFIDSFTLRLKDLEKENHKLKVILMESDRYKNIQKKLKNK